MTISVSAKIRNIVVYNSTITNITTLKLITFHVSSVNSVNSVRFRYLTR